MTKRPENKQTDSFKTEPGSCGFDSCTASSSSLFSWQEINGFPLDQKHQFEAFEMKTFHIFPLVSGAFF